MGFGSTFHTCTIELEAKWALGHEFLDVKGQITLSGTLSDVLIV